MYEAAQTNASAAGIGAIVAVAVGCLAFWLIAMAIAARDPGVPRPRTPGLPGPVLGGIHVSDCARSVSPSRDSEATFADSEADALGVGTHTGAGRADAGDAGTADADAVGTGGAGADAADAGASAPAPPPGAVPVPTPRKEDQPKSTPTAAQAMLPGQRTADADQPRHTRPER